MTPERQTRITNVLRKRQPDLTIVLENVHDPHNISAVMRTADSVGIQEIYVLNTQIGIHKKFGKKSSASAANWLTVHQYNDRDVCFAELRSRYDKIYATHLGVSSRSLYELNLTEAAALIFGNEHSGVSDETLRLCDGNFIIPQVGMVQSLNISVACAVSLYEAFRQRQQAGFYNQSRLSKDKYDELAQKWRLITK